MTRFTDPQLSIATMASWGLDVVCPQCKAKAAVVGWARLTCPSCSYVKAGRGNTLWGGPVDPHFHQPLWWQADFRGHTLWAFNRRHLTLLENYVAADLRERGPIAGRNMTMVAKLPAWLKSAKNRDGILRTIAKMREADGPTGNPGAFRRTMHVYGRTVPVCDKGCCR
ncbi:hypothetical protein SAMN05421504_103399 [Amycolatopsis xylanica]|uniref:Transposase zinc-ribbon domain-containing protein n=1 Tax=Amycolatopsis xylanica TaxID=589385 RepID=A0A1H3DHV6_9PSEU|nr:TFIIB-type zinc ribbon-containing protein [Amycolatopsis xylanica]SDX65961.1 hypothetical protein SAMN05421504_103399 [Amycolatopsis xylanica]